MGKDKQQTKVEDFSENLHVTKPCQPVQKVTGIPKPRPEPRDMPPPPFDVCEESEKVKCPRKPCEDPVVPCCTKKQPPKPLCPPEQIKEKKEWVQARDNYPCVEGSKKGNRSQEGEETAEEGSQEAEQTKTQKGIEAATESDAEEGATEAGNEAQVTTDTAHCPCACKDVEAETEPASEAETA